MVNTGEIQILILILQNEIFFLVIGILYNVLTTIHRVRFEFGCYSYCGFIVTSVN